MPNYFYTDENGQKYGPIDVQRLQTLADRGVITPSTPLETDAGHKGVAGQIRDLTFRAQTAHNAQTLEQAYSQTEDTWFGCMRWGNFDFSDVRIPQTIRRVCGFIYWSYFFWGVLYGIGLTLLTFLAMGEGVPIVAPIFLLLTVSYWLSFILLITIVRLVCEWQIVLMDWLNENRKGGKR